MESGTSTSPVNNQSKPSEAQNTEENDIPIQTGDQSDVKSTNEEEKSSNYDPKNVHYEGELAIYTDPKSGTQYTWCKEKNEWSLRDSPNYTLENDTHVYTDKDGVKFSWDKEKHAWFPLLDDEFMARYQMSYGFSENTETTPKTEEVAKTNQEATKIEIKPSAPKPEKRKASEPTWFEVNEEENTNVYVSGLPTDITEQEFVDLMQKCGLVMRDVTTGQYKVKLYKQKGSDVLKGDALCTYIKIESVDLALNLLDGYDYKNHVIKVEKAKFELKGEYDPKLKPKMRKRKDKIKIKKAQEKLFDWRPEKVVGDRAKHEKVVIVKNLFDPAIFDTDVGLILEFQEDLREEVSKIGTVRKVMLYDRHPEGVAQINMSSAEEADEVVKLLNGRWFMKRQLSAETWNGKTKFKIAETDAQINERLEKWDEFLEDDSNKEKQSTSGIK